MSYDAPMTTRQAVSNIWKWVRAIPRRLLPEELHARAVDRMERDKAIRFLLAKQAGDGAGHGRRWWAKQPQRSRGGYDRKTLAAFKFVAEHGRRPCYNNASATVAKRVERGSPADRAWVQGFKQAVSA
jgi:hypothetical protein